MNHKHLTILYKTLVNIMVGKGAISDINYY